MHLTLQQLKLFEAVSRNRSFTRAAEELFLTQPAVSIQVKRLEDSVGQPLFEQVGKRIYLTAVGREMYAACQDILGRLQELDSAVSELQGAMKGPLHFSVVTSAKYFMPYILGAFVQAYPEVQPKMTVTNRAHVLERLTENQDDLVIMGQVPEEMDVLAHPFLDNPLVVVAHPEHPLASADNVTLKQLVKERFLLREQGSGTRMAVDRLFSKQGLGFERFLELGSSEAIKQGVMAGLGISVLSLHNLRLELAGGHIAILKVKGFPLKRRWYAVHLKGKKLSLVARTFLDFILKESEQVLKKGK